MSIGTLNDFIGWQKARVLCKEVHKVLLEKTNFWDRALKDQLNRSSGSVMDNLAEGFGRNTHNEFIHFLSITTGSLMEVRSQIYRCYDRHFITKEELDNFLASLDELNKIVLALIRSLKSKNGNSQLRRF